MGRGWIALIVAGLLVPGQPAAAKAGPFTLVNRTGFAIAAMAVRRTGTSDWRALAITATAGAAAKVPFDDPDCAFDLRATLAGGAVATWRGVNLCEAKLVTLNRDPASGESWVDYD